MLSQNDIPKTAQALFLLSFPLSFKVITMNFKRKLFQNIICYKILMYKSHQYIYENSREIF